MINYVKDPHTLIFSGPTSCGKTQKVLDLIEQEYKHHFENIVILCPTLRWNATYLERPWVWKDDYVFCFEPRGNLFELLEKLGNLFSGEETLFIVDDVIADETLDKKRQPLLDLAISGRHKRHSLWLLTQSYTAIPKNLRRQKKQLFVWYPSEKSDMKIIDEETNLMDSRDLAKINEQLKSEKHACLYVRLEHPRTFQVLNKHVSRTSNSCD
jgi:hypothetical protein